MKDKEKQIEEMAKMLNKLFIPYIGYTNDFMRLEIAEELLKYYQPKIDKDSVVLSREEYEKLLARPLETMGDFVISKIKNKDYELVKKENYDKLCHLAYFGYDDVYEKGSKETAREILKEFYKQFVVYTCVGDYYTETEINNTIQELAKQYGVEVDNEF